MHRPKEFTWSDYKYSIREFMDSFSRGLPVVVSIVNGSIDRVDEFNRIQICRIAAVKKQRRVVVIHSTGYYVAVPTRIKTEVDIFYPNGKEKRSAKMRDVAKAFHDNPKGSVSIMFKNDQGFSFSFRPEGRLTEINLGKMQVIDVYEERFLVAHAVVDGKATYTDQPLTIPIYSKATLAPVVGLVGGSKEDFRKVLADLEDQMADAITDVKMRDEIVLFPHDIAERYYESISPMAIRSDNTTRRRNTTTSTASSSASSATEKSLIDEIFTPETTVDSDHSSYDDAISPAGADASEVRKKVTKRCKKSHHLGKHSSRHSDRHESTTSCTSVAAMNNNVPSNNQQALLPPMTRKPQAASSDITSELKQLNPSQLAACLQMLNISDQCVNAFMAAGVDGTLVLSIDEAILIDEFQFSKSDAQKLLTFVSRTARPSAT